MHGIEALGGTGAQLRFVGEEASGLLRGLARDLVGARRGIDPFDQLVQRAFNLADLGKLRFGAAKLLRHIGNLLLKRLEGLAPGDLGERCGDLAADLVEPRAQGFERLRRHGHVDRMLKPVSHLGEPNVEVLLGGVRGGEGCGIIRLRQS